jgi:hypothetical protein
VRAAQTELSLLGTESVRAAETLSNIAIALAQLGKMEQAATKFEQVTWLHDF